MSAPHPARSTLWVPSRRTFLAGAAASTLLLACGDDDDSSESGGTTTPPAVGGIVGGLSVARFFGRTFVEERSSRVPFGLADDDGLLPADVAPDEVQVTVTDPDGVETTVRATLYVEGLPRSYYAFEYAAGAAGFYDFEVDTGLDGFEPVLSQFEIVPADDPVVASFVGPGDAMPALATPTVEAPGDVDPICTRTPPCDLHARTVADVVEAGEPFVLMVSTPAFCQTAICGPVLDVLLGVLDDHGGVTAIHAEVYHHPEQNAVPPEIDDFAPVVAELGLPFEPVLYAVGADGVVTERLDFIFGTAEVRALVEGVVA